jgi:HEPN domain-containing protein
MSVRAAPERERYTALGTGGRWLYVVFMCQQAIEKLCKGLYLLYIAILNINRK